MRNKKMPTIIVLKTRDIYKLESGICYLSVHELSYSVIYMVVYFLSYFMLLCIVGL